MSPLEHMSELTDRERLKLIVAALTFCGEPLTYEALQKQFKYETGRRASQEDLGACLSKKNPSLVKPASPLPD